MIRRAAVFVFVVLGVALARAHDADAACSFGGCPDWPSDCHNLKSTKWCAKNGVSTVTITNHGSYESALDWARAEISDPHNGIDNSLTMNQVASGGQIDVYNYTGSADWWGLADQYVTTNGTCLSSARIQVNKGYMTTTVRKRYTLLHEIGHTVGLNHVCVCPRTMNPCGTCGDDAGGDTPYLKTCDAQGIAKKYPVSASPPPPDPAAEDLLYQAHLYDEPRTDLDGDGRSDVCARAAAGLRCHLGTASGFGETIEGPALSDDSGWGDSDNATTLRMLDLDGDGRADICARANAGIRCWTSTGTGFSEAIVGPELGDDGSWDDPMYFTTLRAADFDGDGKQDLCARSSKDFRCWASTGVGFAAATVGPALSNDAGWSKVERYGSIRMGDVDGDGRADVCGRDATGVRCWISDGKGFPTEVGGPGWTDASGWSDVGNWATIRLADVDGDKKADVCGRAAAGFRCHLSTGSGFGEATPGPGWSDESGWNGYDNWSTIRLGDIDGDGDLDVCARANAHVVCAPWDQGGFGTGFAGPELSDAKGWDGPEYFRTLRLADVDGDHRADLCARAGKGFGCWFSAGDSFGEFVLGPGWSDDAGWDDAKYYTTIRLGGVAPLSESSGSGTGSGAGAGASSGGATGGSGDEGVPHAEDDEATKAPMEGSCACTFGERRLPPTGVLLALPIFAFARRRRRRANGKRPTAQQPRADSR